MDMDRPWGEAPQIANFTNQPQGIGSTNLENANFGKLFDQFELNKQEVERSIAKILLQHPQISLRELTRIQPITKGLEEVITYFSIAAQSPKHKVDNQHIELIEWMGEDGVQREIALPRLEFGF
jgi:hypothetical protein